MNASDPNRTFPDVVIESFAFLEHDYGYQVTECGSTRVVYETDCVWIAVYYGRQSFELGVEFCRKQLGVEMTEVVRLSTVLAALVGPSHALPTFFQTSNSSVLVTSVRRIADIVRAECAPILAGDAKAFDQVARRAKVENEIAIRQLQVRPLRERAAMAWRDRNYTEYIANCEALGRDMTPVEAAKLAYARKHGDRSSRPTPP